LLKRFPGGEDKFAHWSFWPSTVLTAGAGLALLDLFDRDEELSRILAASRLWATEEVLFPTLASLFGFRIERNPCAYGYVKYRTAYSLDDLDTAWQRPDAFWIHPIQRHYADPARVRISTSPQLLSADEHTTPSLAAKPPADLLSPILQRMRNSEGWLEDEEAELLALAVREVSRDAKPKTIIEIGSYCGKATFVLAARESLQSAIPDCRGSQKPRHAEYTHVIKTG
jgi:hypothetical protein